MTPSTYIQSRTAVGEAFSSLTVQIFRLNGLLLAAGDALAEPTGQTSARWRVLAAVEHEPQTVAQIARSWDLARQSVQRVANVLVKEKLAMYKENPRHRRAQLLVLTPKGRAALTTIQSVQLEWANKLGAEIGEANLRQANKILARVISVVVES